MPSLVLEAKHQTSRDPDILLIRFSSGTKQEPVRLHHPPCEMVAGVDIQAAAERHCESVRCLSSAARASSTKQSMNERSYFFVCSGRRGDEAGRESRRTKEMAGCLSLPLATRRVYRSVRGDGLDCVRGYCGLTGGNPKGAFTQVSQSMGSDTGSDRAHLPPPAAGPVATRGLERLEVFAQLQKPPAARFGASSPDANAPAVNGPMIIRTAELSLITKEFDNARSAMESILKRHRGYVGELKLGGSAGSGRTLNATLRVPADQLDATLIAMKTLGRVESEAQGGEDVTSQYVDLEARLANARNTERRLTELLQQRTGNLSDVLAVENEHARVRGEIERMEAEKKNMSNQVSFATLTATIAEDYKAQLQVVPPSTSTRLSNAAVEGYKSMVDGIVSLVLFLLEDGPTLLLWGAILFFPARWVWKRVRHGFAH